MGRSGLGTFLGTMNHIFRFSTSGNPTKHMPIGYIGHCEVKRGQHRWRTVFNCGCQNTHRGWRTPITSKTDTHSESPTPIAPISVSRKENVFSFYETSFGSNGAEMHTLRGWYISHHLSCVGFNLQSTSGVTIGQGLSYPRSVPLKLAPAPLWRVLTAKLPQTAGPSMPHRYRRSQRDSDRRSQRASDRRCQRTSDRRASSYSQNI